MKNILKLIPVISILLSIVTACNSLKTTQTKEVENLSIPKKVDFYEKLQEYRKASSWSEIHQEHQLETYGTYETFVDNYEKALTIFDTVMLLSNQTEKYENNDLLEYVPIDAKKEILNNIGENRLLLINEAHHRPEHRAFTESLLNDLYKLGFRYLAMEALNPKDTTLNTKDYPVKTSGFYIQEIMFSNLFRTAKEIGFTLVAYEALDARSQNERDSLQAISIYEQTITIDDDAKVVVHAGYGHIGENYSERWRAMGYQLKQITGINPLTIDQTSIPEILSPECTTPLYASLEKKFNINMPIILKKDDKIWNFLEHHGLYDISVIHPPFKRIKGRSHWLVSNGRETRELPKELLKNKYKACLVEIFEAEASEDAIPLDRFELDKTYAVLKEGEYRIVVFDKNRKEKYRTMWKIE